MGASSFDRDEHSQACMNDDECDAGTYCYERLCIGDSATNESCAQGSQIEVCYEGSAKTREVGMCSAGQRICIESQIVPSPEDCGNPNSDDDCNDLVDDVPGVGSAADEAWACAFGDGDATTPSQLDWFESCAEDTPLACE